MQAAAGPVWWNALRCYREARERFYCTLCIHTSDTCWRDVSGRCAANAGGGSLYRSRSRWQKSQELTESRWLQLMTFQLWESLQSWDTTNHLTLNIISKYWMTVLMNWGGKDRLYVGFHLSNFEALSFKVLWAFRHTDNSVFSPFMFCILLLVAIRFLTTSERSDCSDLNNNERLVELLQHQFYQNRRVYLITEDQRTTLRTFLDRKAVFGRLPILILQPECQNKCKPIMFL